MKKVEYLLWKRKQVSILYDEVIDAIQTLLLDEDNVAGKQHKKLLARAEALEKIGIRIMEQLVPLCLRSKALERLKVVGDWATKKD